MPSGREPPWLDLSSQHPFWLSVCCWRFTGRLHTIDGASIYNPSLVPIVTLPFHTCGNPSHCVKRFGEAGPARSVAASWTSGAVRLRLKNVTVETSPYHSLTAGRPVLN